MKKLRAFKHIPDTEGNRREYTAVPEGKGVGYPVYAEVGGKLRVPKNKATKAAFKVPKDRRPPFVLRDYQVEPVAEVVKLLSSESGLFLKAPCGVGKTCMGIAVTDICNYKKVVVLVDQKKLADQWAERISEFLPGATYSVFHSQANKIDTLRDSTSQFDLVVAQSLMTREWVEDPVPCDLLICDEAHVFSAPRFCRAIYNLDYHHSIALTATEDRRDGLEWVFMQFLAAGTVEVQGKTMTAKVVRPKVKLKSTFLDYRTAYCVKNRKMTWKSNCKKCEFWDQYPIDCGGRLPMGNKGVKWGPDLMWTPLVKELFDDESYMNFFKDIILKLYRHDDDRQLMVFNQFRDPLERLKLVLESEINPDDVGIYTSKTKDSVEALKRPITLTTFKMSAKGLDVPWKDTAVLMSPVSDIRQTVGRVTRVKEGKSQPLIIDPVVENNRVLAGQARKRIQQYKDLGFEL